MALQSVVVVSDSAVVDGGAAKVALDSVAGLAGAGLNVAIFAGGTEVRPDLPSVARVRLSGHASISTARQSPSAALLGSWDRGSRDDLGELLRDYDPGQTIVHFHSWGSRLSPSVFEAVERAGFRSVVTAHDYLMGCPNSCFFEFPGRQICERRGGSLACALANCDRSGRPAKAFRLLRYGMQTRALRALQPRVVFVSDYQRRRLDQVLPFSHHSSTISNPIEVDDHTREYQGSEGPFLYAGRLEAEKGVESFVRAATRAQLPALVVGAGSAREALQADSAGVDFTTWLATDELHRVMTRARGLVFPSLWFEGAPLTPIEAQLTAGLPCIVSDACAASDMIDDGVTGLRFRAGDVADLERCLRAMADQETHRALRHNVLEQRQAIADRYSTRSHIEGLLGVYQSALQGPA